jgi:hypothetical protein
MLALISCNDFFSETPFVLLCCVPHQACFVQPSQPIPRHVMGIESAIVHVRVHNDERRAAEERRAL